MASSSSSSKIHLFKKSAIKAGTPEDYYLDPSDNLMKITSAWRVVEHEDVLEFSVDCLSIGDLVLLGTQPEKNEIQIVVALENMERAARFYHKDGMKNFSIKMNLKFLNVYGKVDDGTNSVRSESTTRLFIKKLKLKKESSAERMSDLD
ncbi:hypothetical protein C5167_028618 [Papaver somniferum]|uniref:uncharacterized protein LOC113338460 n=1 Tax=Papaver somniferum TaxID=3469 RepID=UPI000E704419|nr:uncharacterized protein LOC113338460 [Papaver somniferum]RZC90785.1 hypothetical protein C5167_028618 [Papaver somniferum]